MGGLEKIRMLKEHDKISGRRPKVSCKTYVPLKERHYTITFDFASYDEPPSLDDIIDLVNDGLRDEFPNCTINVRESKSIKIQKRK